ncbi:BTAD domain-containing putative transcriptional regulator [Kribbella sp. NPDC056951]|uniref:AfsR/SARP family transcriptional regulator n=1 Tax=Kribbella sp. NPDC056951 TaxID=3345978 RepID=UPI003632045E
MRLRVLGPLEVRDLDDRPQVLGRVKERVLLGMLALRVNTLVSRDALLAGLWEGRPPRSAPANVTSYVSNLRRIMQPGLVLETLPGGYQLTADADAIDLLSFERLVEQGRQARADGQHALAVERLTQAAGFWRGPVMDGLPVPDAVRPEIARLEDLRLTALEECIDGRLELGQHGTLADELAVLTSRHEFRERLWGQRILALYRSGRQSEALAAYQEVHRLLDEHLGIEPGAALRALHQQVLRSDPKLEYAVVAEPVVVSSWTPPRQLPPTVWAFTGRADELAWLESQGAAETMTVMALVGTAGMGKTALAVHWAHRVADRFPDGQLYVDLHGHGTQDPSTPIEVLTSFLRALGVPSERIPTDVETATASYRSKLAGRRVLVILDNAGSAEQVRPLLPGEPGCLTIVTSRRRMTGLVALDGARAHVVGGLTPDDAHELLTRLLGADRANAEPAAVAKLGEVCAHLPLALRLAAARVAGMDGSIEDCVADLTSVQTLDMLAVDDEPSAVRAVFDSSYEPLNPLAQRLFRLLGLVPGGGFTRRTAAALLDVHPDKADAVLDVLVSASMIERRAAGQFVMHDLLCRYATERVAAETTEDRAAALGRLFGSYLQDTETAVVTMGSGMARITQPLAEILPALEFQGSGEALAWLDAQRESLVAAALYAAEHGPHGVAWRLCDQLRGYFWARRCHPEWLTVAEAAVTAAGDDLEAAAAARHCLGDHFWSLGDYEPAIRQYVQVVAACAEAGLARRQVGVLINLGAVHRELGHLNQAHDRLREALDVAQRNEFAETTIRANLGALHVEMGRMEDAVQEHTRVVDGGQASAPERAFSLNSLATAHRHLGHLDEAQSCAMDALALHRETGNRAGEASALETLAAIHLDRDHPTEAFTFAKDALAIAQAIANPRAETATLTMLAAVHLHQGDHTQAEHYFTLGLESARTNRITYTELEALLGLAATHQATARPTTARALATEARQAAQASGFAHHQATAETLLRTM